MTKVKYYWPEAVTGKRVGVEIEEEGDKTKPYSEKFWSQIEILPYDKVKELQWKRLEFLLKFSYENSPFYREKWDGTKVKPSDIKSLEDLPKLPIITKADCTRDREENPPFGTIATSPGGTHLKYFQTSGTTGRPQAWTIPWQEWEDNMMVGIRALYAHGIRAGWRGFYAFGFPPFPAYWGMWDSSEMIGCQNIPKGALPTPVWLEIMKTLAGLAPSYLAATPTNVIRQMEACRELGINPSDLQIKVVIISGEPGYGIPATNKLIREGWNAETMDVPGSTETNGCFMYSCSYLSLQDTPSEHLASDCYIFEVLDPKTLEPVEKDALGVREGVSCVTSLVKIGMPAVRYLLNDYVTIKEGEICGCGRTLPIVIGGIQARADDMIIVKGVNIYPAIIEESVRSIQGLSPEYQIKKTVTGAKVLVEPLSEVEPKDYGKLAQALEDHIKKNTLVRMDIEILPPGTLPRMEAKTKRVA